MPAGSKHLQASHPAFRRDVNPQKHRPFQPVNNMRNLAESEQLEARGYFVKIDHPEAGEFRYPGAPAKLSKTPWRMDRPAPLLGEHNVEVVKLAARCGAELGADIIKTNYTGDPDTFKEAGKVFAKAVKEDIFSGEIIQGVFSQRFEVPLTGEAFDYYRALRVINPSPYMFYFKMDSLVISGSSPEVMVKVLGRKALLRPIAGTRPARR